MSFLLRLAVGGAVMAGAVAISPANGACHGPLDCNAAECYDCSCTNGQCACADGWAGEHCETPFCANRTVGCSGHGNCQQTLHNISCACDDGFVGDHCETATCALKCVHGGAPDAACKACTGCLGAWGGTLCDTWNDTVPTDVLMSKLQAVAGASQKMLDAQAQFNPVCRQGHECVGWGVDGFTGKPTLFPIVHLSYDPTRTDKKFNNLSEPVEVESNHIVSPVWASTDGANAFPRMSDFVQHINSAYAGATPVPKGTNGVYSSGFDHVFDTFFQQPDDRALSVVRAVKSYISMSLPVDPTTHTRQYELDRFASTFVQSLPPAYNTDGHKQQFRYFIKNYGTSFATSATLGGLVEQYSVWKSWLTDPRLGGFVRDTLVRNAQVDFGAMTGLPGPGGAPSAGYDNATRTLEPLECIGGDSAVSCDAGFAQWAATIPQSPVLLDFELAPISDLITDPDVKAGLESAVKEYIQEQRDAWAARDKCPPSCGPPGSGNCSAGQDACTCSYDGLVGRMCTGCAPVSVRGTFTDIKGDEHSGTTTVACDGPAEVAWSSGGSLCEVKILGSCYAVGEVKCARTKNGNLVATVNQPTCEVYMTDDDDGGGKTNHTAATCGGFGGTSAPPSGVTGGSATVGVVADKKNRCEVIPSARRRRSYQSCEVKASCEFA